MFPFFLFYITKYLYFSLVLCLIIFLRIYFCQRLLENFFLTYLKQHKKIEEFASFFTIKNLSSKSVKNVERRRNQSVELKHKTCNNYFIFFFAGHWKKILHTTLGWTEEGMKTEKESFGMKEIILCLFLLFCGRVGVLKWGQLCRIRSSLDSRFFIVMLITWW